MLLTKIGNMKDITAVRKTNGLKNVSGFNLLLVKSYCLHARKHSTHTS